MFCCGCRRDPRDPRYHPRIVGEGGGGGNLAFGYPQTGIGGQGVPGTIQYIATAGGPTMVGSQTMRRVHYPPDGHTLIQGNPIYGTPIRTAQLTTLNNMNRVSGAPPEMVLQSDFRKVSGISSEMFRQIEAVEKSFDPSTASLIEAVERRGEMVVRILDPRLLGRQGMDAHRKYLSQSVNGQIVSFVEIIKRPGQTLGLYIREGDGINTNEGVFISRIALESSIYNSGVLKVNDEILAVNLVDVRRMSLDDVVIVMSIPRRLVLIIRSRLYRPGASPGSTVVTNPYAEEYNNRAPVVVHKKNMNQEDESLIGKSNQHDQQDDPNGTDAENGRLMQARLKGIPLSVPSHAVALDGQQEPVFADDTGLYTRGGPMRNILRPMTHARDDTYVQIYQKAADARTRPGSSLRQPSLQRVYPGTFDNLASQSGYASDTYLMKRGGTLGGHLPRHLRSGRMSALGTTRYMDDYDTGSLIRATHMKRPGSSLGLMREPSRVEELMLESLYARPGSRTSLRSRLGPSTMQDIRSHHRRQFEDLRSSLSSHALTSSLHYPSHHHRQHHRRTFNDGSASDTEAAISSFSKGFSHHGLKHPNQPRPGSRLTSGRYSQLSGRSSVTDALRSSSLPRQGYTGRHHRRSHSRTGVPPSSAALRALGRHAFPYDDESDGAVSAPEAPEKASRRLLRRGPSPGLGVPSIPYSSNDYNQWLGRAPSTSAIYESVRKSGVGHRSQLDRPSSALASGLSNTSLAKIAHSTESLLETIRLETQKNLLADLYSNRSVAGAALQGMTAAITGRRSPFGSSQPRGLANPREDLASDVLSTAAALKQLRSQQLSRSSAGPPLLPSSLATEYNNYLRSAIPNPTPVKASEDSRMHLLTLNPREFFKYRYDKATDSNIPLPPHSSLSNDTHADLNTPLSMAGTVIDSSISRPGNGFSGILWIHLLAGRGLRATPATANQSSGQSGANSATPSVTGPGLNRDLYCVIECDRVHRARTVVRSGESSFDWDEVFELDLVDCKEVSFLLYSWDPQLRHKLCYKGIVNLISLSLSKTPVHSLALKMEPRGTLYIKMRYKEPAIAFQRTMATPPPPSGLFGLDVETVVTRENSGSNYPLIIKRCLEEVEKRGLDLVGIYRLCGSAVRKKMLREAFEKNPWLVDLSAEHVPDINVITSLIKDYLREIPEPLFAKALFDMMVDGLSVCLPDDPAGNAKLMFSILECLPDINRATVEYIMDHLKLVALHSEKNKMTSQSLAMIFGPLFTCHSESDYIHKSVEVFKFLLDIWPNKKGGPATIPKSVPSRSRSTKPEENEPNLK